MNLRAKTTIMKPNETKVASHQNSSSRDEESKNDSSSQRPFEGYARHIAASMKKHNLKAFKNKSAVVFHQPRFTFGVVNDEESISDENIVSSGQNNLNSLGKNDGCTGATNNRANITKQLK